ncbi:MAG: hypothetical protein KC505_11150 [Myxococcales bacterium]|nr:hypothetical protein [Myxococcales bacterium]
MSFWPGLQITLEHVFKSATGIPFVWDNDPIKVMEKPYGVLSLGQCITVGRDYSSYDFADKDPAIDTIGYRELTISIQIFSRQARGEQSARALIERARLCLASPVYKDELRSAGLVFVETHPVTDVNFSFQNRLENRSIFEVVFRLVVNERSVNKELNYFELIAFSENFQ